MMRVCDGCILGECWKSLGLCHCHCHLLDDPDNTLAPRGLPQEVKCNG